MQKLVKNGDITEDYWTLVEDDQFDLSQVKKGNALLALKAWADNQKTLSSIDKLGVWLAGDTALDDIPEFVFNVPTIAIAFPVFTDGRGFSLARQIREYKDFSGDLRAIGQFAIDQMFYLKRCGFSSFVVSSGSDAAIQTCLKAFSDSYQAAADEPRPLFRRR